MLKKISSKAMSAPSFSERVTLCGWNLLYTNEKGIRNSPLSAWQCVVSCPFCTAWEVQLSLCHPCQWERWNPVKYRCTSVIMTKSHTFLARGDESDSNSEQQSCGQCCGHRVASWQCNVLDRLFSGHEMPHLVIHNYPSVSLWTQHDFS